LEKRRGKKPGASFDNLQFQRVEDMVVLNEVCDFVMTDVGAITEYHIECWKDRRMCLEENPASAYALLKQDALTLAASQKTFRADVEVYRLITTKDLVGGPFFTYALHAVRSKHDATSPRRLRPYGRRLLLAYFRGMGVVGQRTFTEAVGTDLRLWGQESKPS
jgi:hypothetical protein